MSDTYLDDLLDADDGAAGPDPLDRLWGLFELPDPVVAATETLWWPAGVLDALVTAKLLVPTAAAGQVACPGCADRHVEEVTAARRADGTALYYIPCADAGRAEVPADLLRQWRPDFGVLARVLKERMGINGRVSPQLPGRLWRLGAAEWRGADREAYLARGLSWRDGPAVAAEIPADGRPVVFVGAHGPDPSVWPSAPPPPVVLLPTVLSAAGGAAVLNHRLLARVVAGADELAAAAVAATKAELRRQVDRLIDARAAGGGRDALIAHFHGQGMSTSEIAAELAKRDLPLHRSNVARKIRKVATSPPPTRPSSRSILRPGSSQPRDTSGRPMPGAQPEPDE